MQGDEALRAPRLGSAAERSAREIGESGFAISIEVICGIMLFGLLSAVSNSARLEETQG